MYWDVDQKHLIHNMAKIQKKNCIWMQIIATVAFDWRVRNWNNIKLNISNWIKQRSILSKFTTSTMKIASFPIINGKNKYNYSIVWYGIGASFNMILCAHPNDTFHWIPFMNFWETNFISDKLCAIYKAMEYRCLFSSGDDCQYKQWKQSMYI